MTEALFFYLFAGVMLASGLMVVVSRNPVYSVLFLILAFFNAAGMFVLIGAEFLAMLLIVVYVGAVAVLFLAKGSAPHPCRHGGQKGRPDVHSASPFCIVYRTTFFDMAPLRPHVMYVHKRL